MSMNTNTPKPKRDPFNVEAIGTVDHFFQCEKLMRHMHSSGRWSPELAGDWGHLCEWGWTLGISLPTCVEDYPWPL